MASAKIYLIRMRLSTQFFIRDFGDTDNSEVKIDFAYGDYFFEDWLGVRFGLLKAPHGLYSETRDIDMLRNPIFLPQSVYEEVLRSATLSLQGFGLYGHLNMRAAGGLSYQLMYGTQTIPQNSRMGEAMVGYPIDLYDNENIDVEAKYAGNIVWATPLEGLRLGVSYDNVKMSLLARWNTTVLPVRKVCPPGIIRSRVSLGPRKKSFIPICIPASHHIRTIFS